jgi:hypothetical protein
VTIQKEVESVASYQAEIQLLQVKDAEKAERITFLQGRVEKLETEEIGKSTFVDSFSRRPHKPAYKIAEYEESIRDSGRISED